MTEPMHCDHERVCRYFGIGSGTHCHGYKCEHDTRARGPVQQAPAAERVSKPECYGVGFSSMDVGCCNCGAVNQCRGQKDRDAALIAQEREKWERERAQTSPDKCCIGLTYEQCQEVSAREKAQAREDVLKELYLLAEDMISDGQRMIREEPEAKLYGKGKFNTASVFQMRIESLRSEVRK